MLWLLCLKSPGIDRLSVEERLTLVEDLWESIAEESAAISLSGAKRAEPDRRLADYAANPKDVIAWENIKTSITARLKR